MNPVEHISKVCIATGLDLIHPFAIESKLSLIIGNTRKLWEVAKFDVKTDNPIESYVEKVLQHATNDIECSIAYSHTQPFIPIQRIAQNAGFAWLSKANLSIHPVYGPWFALRAVIYLEEEGQETAAIKDPCLDCQCDEALRTASKTPDDWHLWLSLRDQCPLGRTYRYSEQQILYHYTKDRQYLPN